MSGLLGSRTIELTFVAGSIVLAGICAAAGCRVHRKWKLLGLAGAGAVILVVAHMTAPPNCCPSELGSPHTIATALGGGLLAVTHFLNLRLRRVAMSGAGNCCSDQSCASNG